MSKLTPANGIGVYAADFFSGMFDIGVDAFKTLQDFTPAFERAPSLENADKLDNKPQFAPAALPVPGMKM